MINSREPVSFIIFKDEKDDVVIWIQHAQDFQETYEILQTQNYLIYSFNAAVENLMQAMPLILLSITCNKLSSSTEYTLKISGSSINRIKEDINGNSLDL